MKRREWWMSFDSIGIRNVNDKPFDVTESQELVHVREVLPKDAGYWKIQEDNRRLRSRVAELEAAARAVCESDVPDYCGMLGIRIDELRTALTASEGSDGT